MIYTESAVHSCAAVPAGPGGRLLEGTAGGPGGPAQPADGSPLQPAARHRQPLPVPRTAGPVLPSIPTADTRVMSRVLQYRANGPQIFAPEIKPFLPHLALTFFAQC